MHALLTQASDALSRNDTAALEAMCTAALAVPCTETDRIAHANALLVFQRQVLAARANLTLRERLLAASRSVGGASWAR